ncbi:MAG: hypothetical protein QXI93_03175 [Candidatus Methanomethylicia archaeon]
MRVMFPVKFVGDVYPWWSTEFSFDLAGIIAIAIIILYFSWFMIREDRKDVELTKIIKENLLPKLESNLMEVNKHLSSFEGQKVIPPSLSDTLYNGLSVTLLSELNLRLPRFANMFRSYVEDLKLFDSFINSSPQNISEISKLSNKIKLVTNDLIVELSKIRNVKKFPSRQGGFASLRR